MKIITPILFFFFSILSNGQNTIVYDKDSNSVQSKFRTDGKKEELITRNKGWKLHGPYKMWDKNEKLIKDHIFDNDNYLQEIEYWGETGKMKKKWLYEKTDKGTAPIGICKSWYKDGTIYKERKYESGSYGRHFVYDKDYYPNGKLKQEEYRDKDDNGKRNEFYENGKKKAEYVLKGVKKISGTEWDEQGNVTAKKEAK